MVEAGLAVAGAGGDGVNDAAADGERGGDVVEIAVAPALRTWLSAVMMAEWPGKGGDGLVRDVFDADLVGGGLRGGAVDTRRCRWGASGW